MKNESKKTVSALKKEDCCGCHSCYNACPKKAIQMISDDEGFLYPEIEADKCVSCGICVNKCPAVNRPELLRLNRAYACCAKDRDLQMKSSSGAVFALLSNEVLSEGGVVCAAAFDDNLKVIHFCTDDAKQAERFKTSKYVQSEIGSVYSEIKEYLTSGRKVLFAGTPCQAAGLKAYLNKDYEELVTVDLICHGVPSPEVWKKYLSEIADGRKVTAMTFRNKEKGIDRSTLDYTLENGTVIQEKYGESPYIKGFISNLYLRPSCYRCHYKGCERCSDITIGDFWSAKEYYPEVYSQYGTSAVIIHSTAGRDIFQKIYGQLQICDAKPEEIAVWNSCLLEAVKEPEERKAFFEQWQDAGIADVVSALAHEQKQSAKKGLSLLIERVKKWLT